MRKFLLNLCKFDTKVSVGYWLIEKEWVIFLQKTQNKSGLMWYERKSEIFQISRGIRRKERIWYAIYKGSIEISNNIYEMHDSDDIII